MNDKIFVFCGKSGSGKDFYAHKIKENINLKFVVSTTSRPMRSGEVDGREYNFTTKENFLKKIEDNEFIEYRSYDTLVDNTPNTWYYGTEKKSIKDNESYIMILDKQGLIDIKNSFGDRVIGIYLYVDDKEREIRAKNRDENFCQVEWDRRIKDDEEKFKEIENLVDFSINNNRSKEEVFRELLSFIESNIEQEIENDSFDIN